MTPLPLYKKWQLADDSDSIKQLDLGGSLALLYRPTEHGVSNDHCKYWSSKNPPVSSEKSHKRLDPVSKKLIIKSQVELMIIENLKQISILFASV